MANTEMTAARKASIEAIADSLAGASNAQDVLLGKIAAAANGLIAYFGIAGKGHNKDNPFYAGKSEWDVMRAAVSALYLEHAEKTAKGAGRQYDKATAQGRFRAELKRAAALACIVNPDSLDKTTDSKDSKTTPKKKPGAKHTKLHRCPCCEALLVISKGALVEAPKTIEPKAKAKAKPNA